MKNNLLTKITGCIVCTSMLMGLAACGSQPQPSETAEDAESSAAPEAETTTDTEDTETAVVEANNETGEGVTLTIGVWADDESKRLEKAFEGVEEDLGIHIEFLKYPSDSDFWDNIPAQIAAGTAPDIISCTNEHYLQYIDQGLF